MLALPKIELEMQTQGKPFYLLENSFCQPHGNALLGDSKIMSVFLNWCHSSAKDFCPGSLHNFMPSFLSTLWLYATFLWNDINNRHVSSPDRVSVKRSFDTSLSSSYSPLIMTTLVKPTKRQQKHWGQNIRNKNKIKCWRLNWFDYLIREVFHIISFRISPAYFEISFSLVCNSTSKTSWIIIRHNFTWPAMHKTKLIQANGNFTSHRLQLWLWIVFQLVPKVPRWLWLD